MSENSLEDKDQKLEEIKSELQDVKEEIRSYRKKINTKIKEEIKSSIKSTFFNKISNLEMEKTKRELDDKLFEDCNQKKNCLKEFIKIFNNLHDDLRDIDKEKIKNVFEEKKKNIKELRKEMPYDRCDICFKTASNELNKQKNYFQTLKTTQIGKTHVDKDEIIPKKVVEKILSPIANEKRIMILNALRNENKSFSELSDITNLSGGNLMFHLDKLKKSGFLVQKHLGSEYAITYKGKNTLKAINWIKNSLKEKN